MTAVDQKLPATVSSGVNAVNEPWFAYGLASKIWVPEASLSFQ